MNKINSFLFTTLSWVLSFIIALIVTTIMCVVFILAMPVLFVIFPFMLAGRLQLDILNQSGNNKLMALRNYLFWHRSKELYPAKRIWRWKFHFKDDYNCWITATNKGNKFKVKYEGTKIEEVEHMITQLKTLSPNKMFWACKKLESEGHGMLAIIYKGQNEK